jgi:coenzyme PQQ precursor peptide PqqA
MSPGDHPAFEKQNGSLTMSWTAPVIVEVCLGMEVTTYASAKSWRNARAGQSGAVVRSFSIRRLARLRRPASRSASKTASGFSLIILARYSRW